jgi:hypothetical protein
VSSGSTIESAYDEWKAAREIIAIARHEPNAASALYAKRPVAVEFDLVFPIRPFGELRSGQALHRLNEAGRLPDVCLWGRLGHRNQYSSGSGPECGPRSKEVRYRPEDTDHDTIIRPALLLKRGLGLLHRPQDVRRVRGLPALDM